MSFGAPKGKYVKRAMPGLGAPEDSPAAKSAREGARIRGEAAMRRARRERRILAARNEPKVKVEVRHVAPRTRPGAGGRPRNALTAANSSFSVFACHSQITLVKRATEPQPR